MSTPAPDRAALDDAHVLALAALPRMTSRRLHLVLRQWPDPERACTEVRAGRAGRAFDVRERDVDALAQLWTRAIDPGLAARRLAGRGTKVRVAGTPGYPIDEGIEDRPAVLFIEGERIDALDRPRVSVVGTRAATPHGLADARELGGVLARAGVVVVSGLAIGIDAAAHEGALDAGGAVIGVIATGLDVVYPRRHQTLYERVRRSGLLVTEHAFGVQPRPQHFPVRNRVIAALGDCCVVVEATASGGAMITARHALDYGRAVLAMPGSRRNPSAAGTNALIAEGAHPLIDPEDALVALGLSSGDRRHPGSTSGRPHELPGATPEERSVYRHLSGEPATADELVARTGLSPGAVAVAVAGLVRSGAATRAHGLVWPA